MGLFFWLKKHTSRYVAKDRLKSLLVSDRANCSQTLIEHISNDMFTLLSKYNEMDIDKIRVEIVSDHQKAGATPWVVARVPFKPIDKKSG